MREEVAAWLVSASQTLVDVAGVVSPVFLVGFALSIFRRTRPWTGAILYWFSFLAGAATWFYGAGITFASFGWVGLFVGLVLLGVGVVPMGVIGGLLEGGELAAMARGLLLMVVVTFLFRGVGVWLLRSGPATAQQLDRIRWLVGNRDGAERADRGPETEASADELIRRLEALPQRRAEDELTEDDSAPVISPEEAREWVSGTLHGSRVRLAECLRAEGRDQLYLIKPRGFPLSGWFRPNWLEDAQGRVYATRAAAQNAAGYSGFMGAMEALERGGPLQGGELAEPRTEVVQVQRLPSWVREVEMADGKIVQLRHDTFAGGCGCLMYAGVICGGLVTVTTAWLRGLTAGTSVAVAVLLGLAVLIASWRFSERSDAEARAICLCGLPLDPR